MEETLTSLEESFATKTTLLSLVTLNQSLIQPISLHHPTVIGETSQSQEESSNQPTQSNPLIRVSSQSSDESSVTKTATSSDGSPRDYGSDSSDSSSSDNSLDKEQGINSAIQLSEGNNLS